MPRRPSRKHRPAPFIPTAGHTGAQGDFILRGENMWIQTNRAGVTYAEQYKGSTDMSEDIPDAPISGTLSWVSGSNVLTGVGTNFHTDLHLGQTLYLGASDDPTATEIAVVESIESPFTATLCETVSTTASGVGTRMPVIFALGTKRGTAVRGNALQFPKGHILGVGDGVLRINGQTLDNIKSGSDSLTLSRTPRFALYDPATDTWDQQNVGLSIGTQGGGSAPITGDWGSYRDVMAISQGTTTKIWFTGSYANSILNHIVPGGVIRLQDIPGSLGTALNSNGLIVSAIHTTSVAVTVSVNTSGMTAWSLGGSTWHSPLAATGAYSFRVCAARQNTGGFSNPTPATDPILASAGLHGIVFTINYALPDGADAWHLYSTEWADFDAPNIEPQYMGPWYFVEEIPADQLGTTGTGAQWVTRIIDAEINSSTQLLTFDNAPPVDAEFVDLINGIPIYLSCLGQGNGNKLDGSSPGPVAVPSKPSNPEAVFLDRAITTAGGDTIMGSFNTKGRLFALCQNSLQQVILTSLDFEPITFRSLWDVGFRNPYNVAFVKEYLYGFSTHKIIRSVAGGDDSQIEFDFASDIRDYIVDWNSGRVFTAYDPKNRAVIFFYSAYEKRGNGLRYVTLALPYRLDTQIWNPPMVIAVNLRDQVVSGAAVVGNYLYYLAGGFDHTNDGGTYDIGDVSAATQAVITTIGAHGFSAGDFVRVASVGGDFSAVNGHHLIVTAPTTTTFAIDVNTVGATILSGSPYVAPFKTSTYKFDGGDSETKGWYLAWNYTDSGEDELPKTIKGLTATGKFTSGDVEIHGVRVTDIVDVATLEDGHGNANLSWAVGNIGTSTGTSLPVVTRARRVMRDWGPYSLWTMRISGSSTDGLDRFDELIVSYDINNTET